MTMRNWNRGWLAQRTCVAVLSAGVLALSVSGGCRDSTPPTAPPNPTAAGSPSQSQPDQSAPGSTAVAPGDAAAGSSDPMSTPTGQRMPNAPVPAPPQGPAVAPDDPTIAEFVGLRGQKPATWIWHPPQNRMIHTNYTVPGTDGNKPAFINVYFFGTGVGGSVEDNIARWQNQFRSSDGYAVEPKVDEFEVDGMAVTLVELEGEWMQVGQQWFTKDQAFITAIVEAPAGMVFIRFAGPAPTVKPNRDHFIEMVMSLRKVGDPAS